MPEGSRAPHRGSVAAVLVARNAAATLPRLLDHLATHGIPVVMIDHGSTDGTRDIAAARLGHPVVDLREEPFRGVFDLTRQLELRRAVIARLDVDWIVNLDADEFLWPPAGETLSAFLERQAAEPGEAVDCVEFAFLPASEHEAHASRDFIETMTSYVRFRTRDPKQRVFRHDVPLDRWMATGGHHVSPRTVREPLQLHHYLGLSLDHLRSQYLGRVYSAADLAKGWSFNRRGAGADFIVAPAPGDLIDRRRDGLRGDRPVGRLPVFRATGPPAPAPPDVPPGTDLVICHDGPAALRAMLTRVRSLLPGLRVAGTRFPPPGASSGALLHVIIDGRRRLDLAHAGRARSLAAAWCSAIAAARQAGLALPRYGEVRLEDLEAGEVDLADRLDDLLGGTGPRDGFPPQKPLRACPPGLPAEAAGVFEAVAGPLLRDLGYAPASRRQPP